jgi:hypothetical protein
VRLFSRKPRNAAPAGRVLPVEPSTVVRAGDAATRLALEDTLLRKGWRVLYFEEGFGPLLDPQGERLDGIAFRLRPGQGEALELRLVRVESGTVDVREDSVEQLRRLARSASLEWLLAAFDGEEIRLVPDLDGLEDSLPTQPRSAPAPRPQEAPRVASRGEVRRGPSREAVSKVPAAARLPAASPAGPPARPGGRPTAERRGTSRRAPRRSAPAPSAPAPTPAPGARRGERSAPPASIAVAHRAAAPASPREGQKKRRRRGKRGGRGRTRRHPPEGA